MNRNRRGKGSGCESPAIGGRAGLGSSRGRVVLGTTSGYQTQHGSSDMTILLTHLTSSAASLAHDSLQAWTHFHEPTPKHTLQPQTPTCLLPFSACDGRPSPSPAPTAGFSKPHQRCSCTCRAPDGQCDRRPRCCRSSRVLRGCLPALELSCCRPHEDRAVRFVRPLPRLLLPFLCSAVADSDFCYRPLLTSGNPAQPTATRSQSVAPGLAARPAPPPGT